MLGCDTRGLDVSCSILYIVRLAVFRYIRSLTHLSYRSRLLLSQFLLLSYSCLTPLSTLVLLSHPSPYSSLPFFLPPQVLRRRTKDVKTMQRQAANKTASTSSSLKEGGGMGTGIRRRRRLVRLNDDHDHYFTK